jgi:hypothetical protein
MRAAVLEPPAREAGRAQELQHLLGEGDMRARQDRQAKRLIGRLDDFGPQGASPSVRIGVGSTTICRRL